MKIRKVFSMMVILALLFQVVCYAEAQNEITVPVIEEMKQFDIPDNEAMRFVRDMKTGWNLGNTFDAHHNGWYKGDELGIETIWCGAMTTRELISALKEAGFNTIRIPVSWHHHVDENNMITEAWMNRVREVAGWALDEGMYVIVNVHHDNEPYDGNHYFYPDSEHYELSAAFLSSIWKQMAEAFADCDDHLILEAMNEPRLTGTNLEWSFNTTSPLIRDAADCINKLNQLFVDTVRSTGGNNASRYLAIPGYTASPEGAVSDLFRIPADTAENRIIVSVHAYTPYDFALNTAAGTPSEFDLENGNWVKTQISTFMNSLYNKYISNGIPVVIDEYGALNKHGNLQDRVNFAAFYTCAASARGMTCCWWDNHNFTGNGEQFGLIDRKKVEWKYPEIVEAIMVNCLYNRK